MLFFISMEVMFFGGLISAFLVLKADASGVWPPAGQPRLPVAVTGVNTALLILSGLFVERALLLRAHRRRLARWLSLAAFLGLTFLVVQGFEWGRLLSFGLTLTSSLYGGTFYLLIGAHGLHVAGGLTGLFFTLASAAKGSYDSGHDQGLRICRLYWWFVVGIWPVLYLLVYF